MSMDMKTMKCDKAKLLLVSLADRALSGAGAGAVEEHVAGCAHCRQELESLKADAALLRQDVRPEVPAWLAARITAKVRERRARARPWYGLNPVLTRVAAIVLVVAGVWLGTVLGRAIVGNQPSLDERLAEVGVQLPTGGRI